jgi:DNA-binding transcriptional LysR family regulator
MQFEWGDIRYFLAVARKGTTLAAARALGVNQTTCARRIAALERSLGGALFLRSATGYTLTPLGAALVAQAEKVETSAGTFGQLAAEAAHSESTLIRFSTSDWMADLIAQPALVQFARLHPHIRIAMDVSAEKIDLGNGDADVALRGGFSVDEPTLIARKVAETPWAFYCGVVYRRELPRTMEEVLAHPLAVPSGQAEKIFTELRPDVRIGFSTNSTAALIDAIASGDFVGPLPRAVGDRSDDLRFCCAVQYPTPSIWIIYPERLRGSRNVRVFVDHLTQAVRSWASCAS